MVNSRSLLSASKYRLRQPLTLLLQRCDPSKRTKSSTYTNWSRQYHGKPGGDPVINVEVKRLKTSRSWSWSTYVIPVALLGFAGIATVLHYNDERRAVPRGHGKTSSHDTVKGPTIGGPFALIDSENRIVTEKNLLGNWVLLYFGYTSSPDVGPEQVQMMAETVDKLETKHNLKVSPIFITLDPQRDTPVQLRAYLKEFNPRIVGLTGPVGAIRQVAHEYRIFFKKVEEEGDDYLIESSHNMYLLNPSMEVVRCFGVEYTADEVAEEILKIVKKSQT